MALVLSLREQQDFYVGEERFIVQALLSDTKFVLRNDRTGQKHTISDDRSEELVPDVFVSAGFKPPLATARVVIDAPQEVLVLRGEKKRAVQGVG
jgi:hypothetical protein